MDFLGKQSHYVQYKLQRTGKDDSMPIYHPDLSQKFALSCVDNGILKWGGKWNDVAFAIFCCTFAEEDAIALSAQVHEKYALC